MKLSGDAIRIALFRGCHRIDDSAMRVIGRWNNLEELDITNCSFITDTGIQQLRDAQRLRRVTAPGVYEITDAGCSFLGSMPSLESLDIADAEKIGDDGMRALSQSTSLKTLILPGFSRISDQGLRSLREGNAPLESVTISNLDVSETAIIDLSSKPSLRSIRFSLRMNEAETAAEIRRQRPELEVVSLTEQRASRQSKI
jgi:hypothetical protein